MQRHFEQILQELKSSLIKMASLAEDAIEQAMDSVMREDRDLADKIAHGDEAINTMEIQIDNLIVELLALQQPVASDLRLILAASKINNDLERIGDHAVNLAESALVLDTEGHPVKQRDDIGRMSRLVRRMLADAVDAFIHLDPNIGEAVVLMDDSVDNLNRKVTHELMELMKVDPLNIEQAIELIRVSRNLERVADLATNIAEEVVFIARAKVIKHHTSDLLPK
ncbi:MAG TPA: phosphate signaling complex protein PhoU [Bacteroidota bacterium]|nr:phosphate signaling complex protein PhoU [Bacteroidota bacterium]